MRALLGLAAAAILTATSFAVTTPAEARLIDSGRTCQSKAGGRTFCPMPTRHGIYVKRQLSAKRCIRGRTYFVRNRGVEVRNGCRAVFMPYRANRPKPALGVRL